MPHAFGDDERVAAQSHGVMVVPARKAAAFIVVEAEFALQVLVDSLGPPTLHDKADELLLCHPVRQRDEEVVGRLWLAVAPLDEKPERLLLTLRHSGRDNATQGEARPEGLLGARFINGRARSGNVPCLSRVVS
jgi:hypothetical protein